MVSLDMTSLEGSYWSIQLPEKQRHLITRKFQLVKSTQKNSKSGEIPFATEGQPLRKEITDCRACALVGLLDNFRYVEVAAMCKGHYDRTEFQNQVQNAQEDGTNYHRKHNFPS